MVMKIHVQIFIFFIVQLTIIKCQSISLIGTHLVSHSKTYRAFVFTKNIPRNAEINLSLSGNGYENMTRITSENGQMFKEVEFTLPEKRPSTYSLKLTNKGEGLKCKEQTIKLIDMSVRDNILIQTNKLVYKSGDEMKFRIFLLTQKLTPIETNDMKVEILDPNGKVFYAFSNIKTSEFGVYENSFKLIDKLQNGEWKIKIELNGRIKTKKFGIQKVSKRDLQVKVTAPYEVPLESRRVFIDIKAKHPTDKVFVGKATISVEGRFAGQIEMAVEKTLPTISITDQDKRTSFSIQDELGIAAISDDLTLTVHVDVSDTMDVLTTRVSKKVIIKPERLKKISIGKRNFFIPGINFPLNVNVKNFDGTFDNSLDYLDIEITYHEKDQKNSGVLKDKKELVNGEQLILLKPNEDTIRIDIFLKSGNTNFTTTILPRKDCNIQGCIQATLARNKNGSSETINVTVESFNSMEELHIMVIGPQGLSYKNSFSRATDKDLHEFSFKLTDDMRPEASVIIYYVTPDLVTVYDVLTLKTEMNLKNYLNVTSEKLVKPNKNVGITVKSLKQSMIFLTAFSKDGSEGNIITKNSLQEELLRYKKIKFSNNHESDFEKSSAFIVSLDDPCLSPLTFEDKSDDETPLEEFLSSKYFPDVWFDEVFSYDDETLIAKTTTNDYIPWQIHGISIHPKKGIAITDATSELTVSNEIAIMVHAPTFMYQSEVVTVNYHVINYLKYDLESNITITKCLPNAECTSDYKSQKIFAKSPMSGKKFSIKSNVPGTIKLIFTINAYDLTDKVEKLIEVKPIIEEQKKVVNSTLVHSKESNPFKLTILKRQSLHGTPNKKSYFEFHGNLLASAFEHFNKIIGHELDYMEYKLDKFTASIIDYNFLKLVDNENKELSEKKSIVEENYKNLIPDLSPILNREIPLNIRDLAYIVNVLVDAKKVVTVDESFIHKSFEIIEEVQLDNGSFPYDKSQDLRRDISTDTAKQQSTIAMVIIALSKDVVLKEKYVKLFTKCIDSLKKQTLTHDFEKVFIAYAYACSEQFNDAEVHLKSIKKNYLRSLFVEHKPMFVEIVSYIIMTKILLDKDPIEEVSWILSKRSADGGFYSPHDTVLALQALYSYIENSKIDYSNFGIEFSLNGIKGDFSNPFEKKVQVAEFASQFDFVANSNLGYAVAYDETINKMENKVYEKFMICSQLKIVGDSRIEVTVNVTNKRLNATNLVMVEVKLPSGYVYTNHIENERIMNMEIQMDKNLVIFYVRKMIKYQTHQFVVQGAKYYEVQHAVDANVKVYDYYRPFFRDVLYYDLESVNEVCLKRRILSNLSSHIAFNSTSEASRRT